jgi:ThiF family
MLLLLMLRGGSWMGIQVASSFAVADLLPLLWLRVTMMMMLPTCDSFADSPPVRYPPPRASARQQRRLFQGSNNRMIPSTYRSSTVYPYAAIPTASTTSATKRPATTQHDEQQLSRDEIQRYSRHLVLSDVGMAGQRALKNSAVLVIGAGGLGSPALLYLAAAGIGRIGIVDADTVDASNLQRQIIHSVSTVGLGKCESAARRMKDLNPHVHVRLYEEEFTSQTAERIVAQGYAPDKPWDVVIDGSDNFPTKYLIK